MRCGSQCRRRSRSMIVLSHSYLRHQLWIHHSLTSILLLKVTQGISFFMHLLIAANVDDASVNFSRYCCSICWLPQTLMQRRSPAADAGASSVDCRLLVLGGLMSWFFNCWKSTLFAIFKQGSVFYIFNMHCWPGSRNLWILLSTWIMSEDYPSVQSTYK